MLSVISLDLKGYGTVDNVMQHMKLRAQLDKSVL